MMTKTVKLQNGRYRWEIHYGDGKEPTIGTQEFTTEEAAQTNLIRRLNPSRKTMVKASKAEAKAPAKKKRA